MSKQLSSANQFASGAVILAEALKAFLPAEPANVADYAAAHRWLSNEGGGYVGRWNAEMAPYLTGPMMALSDPDILTVGVVGPGQSGKSEIGRNWLFTSALDDPADMLWYSGSEPQVMTESKVNITRLIADHADLRALLTDSSLFFKRFGPMSVQFLAGIMSNLVSKSSPRIVADEFDMICKGVPNAKELLDVRRQTFGARSKLLCLSHPDLIEGTDPRDWKAGIMEIYRDSDRRMWYWPCPECGAWSSPTPAAPRVMTIHYDDAAPDDEIESMARLLCPVNGCLIEDSQRYHMNLHGRWVRLGETMDADGIITGAPIKRDTAGFWITGTMSPFTMGGIGGLARARARAERKYAADNDRKALGEVISKRWGEPLPKAKNVETIDAEIIANRADEQLQLGLVANGVRFITVMIDIQGNRFELLARGWRDNNTSVVVDFQVFEADPGRNPDDWDRVLDFAQNHIWPLASAPGRGMKALAVGWDNSGAPGVTLQSYEAFRRLRKANKARLFGKIDGRTAWNALPLKGASTRQAPRLAIVYPNAERTDRLAQARGEVPLAVFNPNTFKDDLNAQLLLEESAPFSIAFPAALKSKISPHVWFEQLIAEDRAPNGQWTRRQDGRPNEALDLMVGTHVLAFMMGAHRIRWDAPPSWARPWSENPNVVALGAPGSAPAPVTANAEPKATVQRSFTPAEYASLNAAPTALPKSTSRIIDCVPVRRS